MEYMYFSKHIYGEWLKVRSWLILLLEWYLRINKNKASTKRNLKGLLHTKHSVSAFEITWKKYNLQTGGLMIEDKCTRTIITIYSSFCLSMENISRMEQRQIIHLTKKIFTREWRPLLNYFTPVSVSSFVVKLVV